MALASIFLNLSNLTSGIRINTTEAIRLMVRDPYYDAWDKIYD